MRAVDCPVDSSDHIHAANDEQLANAVVSHLREGHPDSTMGIEAARSLVANASYQDAHRKSRGSLTAFLGRIGTGTDLVDDRERRSQ